MSDLNKVILERNLAQLWFDGTITEKQAKPKELDSDMVDYWYGIAYEKMERASNVQ